MQATGSRVAQGAAAGRFLRAAKHQAMLGRRDATSIARSLRLSVDSSRREIGRRVRKGLVLPAQPTRRVGLVWAVSMVKNEQESIRGVVEHLLNQGVDGVLIADNGSTDETPEILEQMRRELPVFVAADTETGYFQAQKMDRLAAWARSAGANWIVPFDADEYWFGAVGTLRESLLLTGAQVARARIYNVFPIAAAPNGDPVLHLDLLPSHLEKVAYQPHPLAKLVHGNHAVIRPGRTELVLRVAHFPWRSFDHFRCKIRSRAPAYRATGSLGHGSEIAFGNDQDKTQAGSNWRYLAGLDDEQLALEWQAVVNGVGESRVAWYRKGDVVAADPRHWSTWDPVGFLADLS